MNPSERLLTKLFSAVDTLEEQWCLPWFEERQSDPYWTGKVLGPFMDLSDDSVREFIPGLLVHSSFAIRGLALHLIAERGLAGFESSVREGLASDNMNLRAMSALAVGGTGDPGALEALLETKDTEHPEVKKAIIGALERLRDPQGIPLLARWVGRIGEDDELRDKACEALGTMGDPAVLPILHRVVEDGTVCDAVRSHAATATARIGGPEAAELLIATVREPESRSVSMPALLSMDHALIVPLLDRQAGDASTFDERAGCIEALVSLDAAEGLDHVRRALKDACPEMRGQACDLVCRIDGAPHGALLRPLLDDEDRQVRLAAVRSYGAVCGVDFLEEEHDLTAALARARKSTPGVREAGDSA